MRHFHLNLATYMHLCRSDYKPDCNLSSFLWLRLHQGRSSFSQEGGGNVPEAVWLLPKKTTANENRENNFIEK